MQAPNIADVLIHHCFIQTKTFMDKIMIEEDENCEQMNAL
jgi:hypothetical protein